MGDKKRSQGILTMICGGSKKRSDLRWSGIQMLIISLILADTEEVRPDHDKSVQD